MSSEKRIASMPYVHNPRKITKGELEQLRESLIEYGDLSGIVFNRRTKQIIGGNQRSTIIDINFCDITIIEEYKKPDKQGTVAIGYANWQGAKYNYREVDWTEEKEKAANILANKLGGSWDNKVLKEHFSVTELTGWGFKKSEIKWLNNIERFNQEDTPGPDQVQGQVHTKLGDIYELNEHKILCGDSLNEKTYDKILGAERCDLCITDPPYNVAYSPDHRKTESIENDKMKDSDFEKFLFEFYLECTKYMVPGSVWYVFHADSKAHIFRHQFIEAGNYLSQILIWVKNQPVPGRSDYSWKHEPVFRGHVPDPEQEAKIIAKIEELVGVSFFKEHKDHIPLIYGWTKGKHKWTSDFSQGTVLNFPKPVRSPGHLTQKPVGLIEYLMTNSSFEDDICIDPFSGSGSTLIACQRNKRIFRGVELVPKHVDHIVRRWVEEMKNQHLHFVVKKNGKDITKQKWIHGEENPKAVKG